MAIDTSTGAMFYVNNSDGLLHLINWESADNPMQCPWDTGFKPSDLELKSLQAGINVTDSAAGLSITTYPNPSNGQFIFKINATGSAGGAALNIIVYDINGTPITELKGITQTGGNENLIWDAGNVSAGIYYYSAKTTSGAVISGKLVKL